jgi:ATP-dependent DNA ligase
MPLSRKPAPFDHPEWVLELKYDGFRSLAVIQNGRCQLISRNGHPFSGALHEKPKLIRRTPQDIHALDHPCEDLRVFESYR